MQGSKSWGRSAPKERKGGRGWKGEGLTFQRPGLRGKGKLNKAQDLQGTTRTRSQKQLNRGGARKGQKNPHPSQGGGQGATTKLQKERKTGPRDFRGGAGVDHREICWVKDIPTK